MTTVMSIEPLHIYHSILAIRHHLRPYYAHEWYGLFSCEFCLSCSQHQIAHMQLSLFLSKVLGFPYFPWCSGWFFVESVTTPLWDPWVSTTMTEWHFTSFYTEIVHRCFFRYILDSRIENSLILNLQWKVSKCHAPDSTFLCLSNLNRRPVKKKHLLAVESLCPCF